LAQVLKAVELLAHDPTPDANLHRRLRIGSSGVTFRPGMTLIPPPTSTAPPRDHSSGALPLPEPQYALVLAWSARQQARVGEISFVAPGERRFLVRSSEVPDSAVATFERQRPDEFLAPSGSALLDSETFRTGQIAITAGKAGLAITPRGACDLRANGEGTREAFVAPGDTVRVGDEALFLCVKRRPEIPAVTRYGLRHDFGEADATGFVGESPEAWLLRNSVGSPGAYGSYPIMLSGEPGSGRHLAGKMLHALSALAGGPFVVRDARTMLRADAYDDHGGMGWRSPLLSAATGGTLLIDHIDECPQPMAALLRAMLDAREGGPGSRYGEEPIPPMQVVGICQRLHEPPHELGSLFARFYRRVRVPALRERREDIPLLVRHLLRSCSTRAAEGGVSAAFMDDLLRRPLAGNVRDLEALVAAAGGSA
jgi:two-component system nitrogen regulation response regulator GlnG/two-component system response regulator HydG